MEVLTVFFMFFVIAGLISIERYQRQAKWQSKQILQRLDVLIELQKQRNDT